ncbi:ComEC/Rec2 family competence protein [Sphingobacterium sp. SYP-B4668]|uniref:ComEC/Rec2 family competence protein n=1 Tax=Sphingobacterium sp. SYP-B4668 TaxID=2996035 RepID=UPI0022DDB027|nr:ComEC/Rec2 family competence protein [Sphingobacterium sp. SYP-B4668]
MEYYTPKHVPLIKVVFFLMIGIWLGFVVEDISFPVFYLEAISVIIVIILILSFFLSSKRLWKRLYVFALYVLLLFLGIYNIVSKNPIHHPNHFAHFDDKLLIGIVDDEPRLKGDLLRCPIRIVGGVDGSLEISRMGMLMMTISGVDSSQILKYGDEIIFRNNIKEVARPSNPREFDYARYLSYSNIWYQSFLETSQIQIRRHNQGNSLQAFAFQVRDNLVEKFRNYILDPQAFHVASAVILGYRVHMDEEIISAFNDTGTIHLLSVSGLHVGLVFGILVWLLSWMDRIKGGAIIRTLIILLCVWAYSIMTGMSAPVIRAAIMISFYIVVTLIRRRSNIYNTIAASAFFMLIVDSKQLADIGFQLSYMAVLGIVAVVPVLNTIYRPKYRYIQSILTYCYVSLGAQLFTLPLIIYYFGQFPNYFLVANLLIAIPSSLIMYLGMGLAILPFESMGTVLGYLLNELIVVMLSGLKFLGALPGAVTRGVVFNGLQVSLFFVVICSLFVSYYTRSKTGLWALVGSILVLNITLINHDISHQNYQGVKFYNVKGDVAVAYIDRGRVTLFSNLDSLYHPVLAFRVLPDILGYTSKERIVFQRILASKQKSNLFIATPYVRLMLLEGPYIPDTLSTTDILFLRRNSTVDLPDLIPKASPKLVLLDGSSSDKRIMKYIRQLDSLAIPYYTMKNNFAYVWDKDLR